MLKARVAKHWPTIGRLGLLAGAIGLGALVVSVPASASGASAPWTIQPSPNPTGSVSASLNAVACPKATVCMAVGDYFLKSGSPIAFAERSVGASWAIASIPEDPNVDASELTGISCPDAHSCTAVGYTVSSSVNATHVRALIEQWDGTTWTMESFARPIGASWAEFSSVSCSNPRSCLAVGGFIRNQINGQEQPLTEQWNGSSWSVLATPNPHAENGSSLTGVDCLSPNDCEVQGAFDYADVDQSVFASLWNGSTWASQTQVNPGGQDSNSDNAISCTSSQACTSVGTWTNIGALGLAQTWNGTTWRRQSVPVPARSQVDNLFGVSCVGGSACTAVGDSADNLNDYPDVAMAQQWDGSEWDIVPVPDPPGAMGTSLSGVSCATPTSCIAVGGSSNGTTGNTLIEKYAG
jgi:hypothetical protein